MTLIFILMKLTCTFSVVKDVKLSIRYRKGKTKCILQWDSNSQPECCKWTLEHLAKMTKWLISTDKYSQHSSIIWSVWLNGWVLVCKLSGCGFESYCSNLNFKYRACFKQRVSWHSGNYRVWIQSITRT